MHTSLNSTDTFVAEMSNWHGRTLGLKTVEALRKNRFEAEFFETREETAKSILDLVSPE
jgi:hypothetical protein